MSRVYLNVLFIDRQRGNSMENYKYQNEEIQEDVIDVSHVFRALKKKIALILIIGVLFGAVAFGMTYFLMTPLYQTTFTVYVNNKSDLSGEKTNSLSNQDLTAARSLASTYAEIISGRTVLEDAAELCGLDASYKKLHSLVKPQTSDKTEIITVYVKAESPEMALSFAQAIIETAQKQISSIIDGSSMSVVDQPYLPEGQFSPSYTKYTLIGVAAGMLLVILIVVIRAVVDDRILDDSSAEERLGYSILGVIPNLDEAMRNKDAYVGYRSGKK